MPSKRGSVDVSGKFLRARVTEVNIEKNRYGAVRVFIPDLMVEGVDFDWSGDVHTGVGKEHNCQCEDNPICMDRVYGWVDENGEPVEYADREFKPEIEFPDGKSESWIVAEEEQTGMLYDKWEYGVDGEYQVDDESKEKPYGILAYPANSPVGGYNANDNCSHYQTTVYTPLKGEWVWVFFEGNNTAHCFYFAAFKYRHAPLPWENRGIREPNRSYTLIKTKMGRSIVVCDSRDKQRIEIMGKKRFLHPSSGGVPFPEGDLWSTYAIDEFKDNCEEPVWPGEIKDKPVPITNPLTNEEEDHNTTVFYGCNVLEMNDEFQEWLDNEGITLQQWLDDQELTLEQFIEEYAAIPGNATSILFDERQGKEKILVRTLYGDFLHIDIDERTLHLDFKNDINIKCGGNLSVDVGGDVNLTCDNNLQTSRGIQSLKAALYSIVASPYLSGCCWPFMMYQMGPDANPTPPFGDRES